jgi:hypothetical protein
MHSQTCRLTALACALLMAICASPEAFAAGDQINLEEGLPTEMEDAYPAAYMNREFQLQAAWEHTADGDDQALFVPRFEYGFARNWQATIAVPFRVGAGEKRNSGDIELEAFYNFNQERGSTPAFALAGHVALPTGRDSEGVDPAMKLLVTKTLGRTSVLQRLNVNAQYTANSEALPDERDDMWKFVIGCMKRVDSDTVFLIDYVWEQEREAGSTPQMAEVGFRRQVTPLRVLVLGASVGLNDDAPDFRLTTGFQQSF